MEGASGIVTLEQSIPGSKEYPDGKEWFNADLKAAIDGLNLAGADEIYVFDEHFYGRNVDLAHLPDNVFVICGKPQYRKDWAGGLDQTFAGLIMVGLHSKAQTPNALLAHTYEDDILDMDVNGTSVGEIGIEAAIAGEMDVPLIMITADSEGVREARELAPQVIGVAVKESLGPNGALCYSESTTQSKIRSAAVKAGLNASDIKPLKLGNPVKLTVTLADGKFLEEMKRRYSDIVEENRVILKYDSLLEAYAAYWQMKLTCLAHI